MLLLRSWFFIGFLSFSLSAFAFHDDLIDCKQHQCIAIVDAGSTASRIHLYTFDHNEQGYPQNINEVYLKKIKPGLGTLSGDAPIIQAYFDKLMNKFPKNNIPIYVYATAGMRLLSAEDQDQKYQVIKKWFADHPQWLLQDLKTITGTEEGAYGFLALNYHLQTLQNPNQPLSGFLEVGGASTQISFPVKNVEGLDENDVMLIDLYGRHLKLYSHSFLGLGANAVFDQSQDHSVCFPVGYPLMNGLIASGDAIKCQQELSGLVNHTYHVDSTMQPALKTLDVVQNWYVTASVSTLVHEAPLAFLDKFTPKDLLQQADAALCHQPYPSLLENYPENDYLSRNCMLASYFYGLWVNGYHFNPEQDIHFFKDYDSSWTLGVILTLPLI